MQAGDPYRVSERKDGLLTSPLRRHDAGRSVALGPLSTGALGRVSAKPQMGPREEEGP